MDARTPARTDAHEATRDEFFDVVRRRLVDVPWERRQRLLAEVADRLDALPEHTPPERVLGDPQAYARLVREAAGLPPNRVKPFPYLRALRRRTKILVLVLPLLTTGLAVGLTAARHYQPLRADADLSYSSTGTIDDPLAVGITFSPYRRGATVVTGYHLENTGWATARVTAVTMPTGSPFALVGLRSQADPQLTGQWERATPVQHLSIPPGGSVELFVVMRMAAYRLGPGAVVWGDQPPLVVRVLGATHIVRPAGNRIGVVAPKG